VDKKAVHMLWKYPTSIDTVDRKEKDKTTGSFNRLVTPRPALLKDYNEGVGGTDLQDQFGSYYRTYIRTKKWPMRIFTHFIMTCVVNGLVVFRSRFHEHCNIPLVDLIEEIIKEALNDNPTAIIGAGMKRTSLHLNDEYLTAKRSKGWLSSHKEASSCRLDVTHTFHHPRFIDSKRENIGQCCVCNQVVSLECEVCATFLCFECRETQIAFFHFMHARIF